jgi:ABC-2 type transport system ATP-binding protein
MMTAVELGGIHKRFGTVHALRDVGLRVERGEMFALVGPDGAGKSTLLRLLAGVLSQDQGRLTVLGRELPRERSAVRVDTGYLSQAFSLYRDLSVEENLRFFAELYGVTEYEIRADELLSFTRLAPFRSRLAGRLSGGMKKKLALACALIHRPALILLDEPTTGVDPVSRRDFWLILGELLREELTIVVATPYLDEAERCGRVGLLNEGQFLTVGTPAELRDQLPGQLVELVTERPRQARHRLAELPEVEEVQIYGDRLHLRLARHLDAADLEGMLRARGIGAHSVTRRQPTLENLFVSLINRERREQAGKADAEGARQQ